MNKIDAGSQLDRAALGRALTRIGNASVEEILRSIVSTASKPAAKRIGVTGPPGAGKSTLIARLALNRLASADYVGVLAVDPSSPISQGSILGDRIRMGGGVSDSRLFFRSMPSRRAYDGLVDNIADLLFTMEQYGLGEIIIETVGVGQVNYTIRSVADTVVLVLVPGAGDEIQAMKAGILEMADIFVVNKSDLPGAQKVQTELMQTLHLRDIPDGGWHPPVLLASAEGGDLASVSKSIDDHMSWVATHIAPSDLARSRLRYHVESLIDRRVAEILDECLPNAFQQSAPDLYRQVLTKL